MTDALTTIVDALAEAIGPLVGKVEQARSIAADLEAELAVCRAHLAAVLPIMSPTWAHDTKTMDAANDYLNRAVC